MVNRRGGRSRGRGSRKYSNGRGGRVSYLHPPPPAPRTPSPRPRRALIEDSSGFNSLTSPLGMSSQSLFSSPRSAPPPPQQEDADTLTADFLDFDADKLDSCAETARKVFYYNSGGWRYSPRISDDDLAAQLQSDFCEENLRSALNDYRAEIDSTAALFSCASCGYRDYACDEPRGPFRSVVIEEQLKCLQVPCTTLENMNEDQKKLSSMTSFPDGTVFYLHPELVCIEKGTCTLSCLKIRRLFASNCRTILKLSLCRYVQTSQNA